MKQSIIIAICAAFQFRAMHFFSWKCFQQILKRKLLLKVVTIETFIQRLANCKLAITKKEGLGTVL